MKPEELEKYTGKDVEVAWTDSGTKRKESASGVVLEIAHDAAGDWLVFDWGYAVRCDVIEEIHES